MTTIQPWLYPNNPYSVDRVTYTPTLSAHILEYQEEIIDAEGRVEKFQRKYNLKDKTN